MAADTAKIFAREGQLMFGQVREDSSVELALLRKLENPRSVFIIASGGCTAFTLLGEGVNVHALDISRAQIALVELKANLFRTLGFDDARSAFVKDARRFYQSVRETLSEDTRVILDSHLSAMKNGLNNMGSVDRRMRMLAQLFFLSVHSRARTKDFLSMHDLEHQQQYYNEKWCNWQWRFATTIGFDKTFLLIAHFQSALQLVPSDFAENMRKRFHRALTQFPNATNPYLWQTFFNEYPASSGDEGLPLYLRKERESGLINNLDNLDLICEDTLAWLKKQDAGSLDFIGLSNILELLPPQYADELLPELIRCTSPGAFVCVRSIFPRSRRTFNEATNMLTLDRDLSVWSEETDRSLFCNFFEIYRRKNGDAKTIS